MYQFTVPMALMDFIPVLCFGAASVILQRDLYAHMRKDATQALYNWIEQGINCAAQGCFLAGALVLHRSGLKDL